MPPRKSSKSVAERRGYAVETVAQAKKIVSKWLETSLPSDQMEHVGFGLPEVDDRYHVWRVPLLYVNGGSEVLGHVLVDSFDSSVRSERTTDPKLIVERLVSMIQAMDDSHESFHESTPTESARRKARSSYERSELANTIILGKAEEELYKIPEESVDLVFTSPPYYNARTEYAEYKNYDEYLELIRKVIRASHRVLFEGCFFVMNISPVLVPRAKRSEASQRIAVPFDMHRLFIEEGYHFIDDIIWKKPEGAGWATGRGRRFSADRNPKQYKAVPVTEYVLVYRKNTDKLIDWNIRKHPDQDAILRSKVEDGYEKTNIWEIQPANDKRHKAIFPEALADRVVKYYSFEDDVVLDPFGGIGTTAKAAFKNQRRFLMVEKEERYVKAMVSDLKEVMLSDANTISTINFPPIVNRTLF